MPSIHTPAAATSEHSPQSSPGAEAKAESGASTTGPAISHFRLDNGMEVVVIPDHRAPVVTHMVWYRNGSADDPRGKSGIAHFLEHLMFKGTAKHKPGEFSHLVAELGGQENAFTSYDFTAYFQRIAREHLGVMMEYEADRMTNLVAVGRGCAARARRGAGRAAHAHAVPTPAPSSTRRCNAALFTHHRLWRADHRLEPRNRNASIGRTRSTITGVSIRPRTPFSWWLATSNADQVEKLARANLRPIPARGRTAAPQSPARTRAPRQRIW